MTAKIKAAQKTREVNIGVSPGVEICASLSIVEGSGSVVLLAFGSGSARHSSRNCFLSEELNRAGYSTMMLDLLSVDEEQDDLETGEYRFDIELLADRTKTATKWLNKDEQTGDMDIVYYGLNASAASSLSAASQLGKTIKGIVSQAGRCDLVDLELPMVKSPVLFIVGEYDNFITGITQKAIGLMRSKSKLVFIEGASHYFEEPGAIEEVAAAAVAWLSRGVGMK